MTRLDDRAYRGEFYRAVDQRQGLDKRQSRFYVPIYQRPELIDQDVVQILFDGVEFALGESVQLLSGFRGSGKTSELLRLRDKLITAGYACVYLDIEDYFNTELPLDSAAFLLGLAAGFATECNSCPGPKAPRERLLDLLKRLRLDGSLKLGVGVAEVDLRAELRDNTTFRSEIEAYQRSNRSTFRSELQKFFLDVARTLESTRVVFIVDSIDHFRGRLETFQEVRESVERLFSEFVDELALRGMHVIYTVPIYVQAPTWTRHDLLNIRVTHPNGTPDACGRDALTEVLRRRAPAGDLDRLLAGNTERIVANSGGLIRDLLRLTSNALLRARALPIEDAVVIHAEQTVRAQMEMALNREQVEILRGVAATHTLTPTRDEWPDATDLMARGAILRYPNCEPWYGVHPLLMTLLAQ